MSKPRKPRLITNCVANRYASPNERIAEFSFPGTGGPAGGLLSLRQRGDGLPPVVELYRVDGCELRIPQAPPKKGSWEAVFGHLGTPDEVGNEFIALKEQRDELLQALKGIVDSFDPSTQFSELSAARAAIAKAAGSTTTTPQRAPKPEWRIERRRIDGRNVCLVVRGYGSDARYMAGPDGVTGRFTLAGARLTIAKANGSAS